ncbi:hypothetical protein T484DRAFT_1795883 [Baffinella frigidus]|nr:hypothetical protein T484DRAFT_1795883 [Cryptophyta sp. CCMP2293]
MDRAPLEKLLPVGAAIASAVAALYLARKLLAKTEWVQVGEVSGLQVYPVKSCQGYSMKTMHLDRFGAVNDRRYMVVDENARFVTQRQESNMCKISAIVPNDGVLFLSAPGVDRQS